MSQPTEPRVTVTIMKACTLAGVTRRTIYNWLNSQKIESVRTAGGRVRIFLDTLFKPNDTTDPDFLRRSAIGKKNMTATNSERQS